MRQRGFSFSGKYLFRFIFIGSSSPSSVFPQRFNDCWKLWSLGMLYHRVCTVYMLHYICSIHRISWKMFCHSVLNNSIFNSLRCKWNSTEWIAPSWRLRKCKIHTILFIAHCTHTGALRDMVIGFMQLTWTETEKKVERIKKKIVREFKKTT